MHDKNSDNNIVYEEENKNDNQYIEPEKPINLFLGEYFSVHTRQYHPLTHKFIERETQRLIDWANQEESLSIQKFWLTGGYSMKQFYRWIKQFPEFEHAHEYAMGMLGVRREEGSLTRKFDASTAHKTLSAYHYIWKQEAIESAKLREDISQNETKVVIIERFPEIISEGQYQKTPEEVAMAIKKSTSDNRFCGIYEEREKK